MQNLRISRQWFESCIVGGHLVKDAYVGEVFLPAGSKVVSAFEGVDNFLTLAIRVPWQPQEFIRQAVNARHPFNASANTEEVENIFKQTLTSSPREVHTRRMELARWLLKLSAEFAERENALHGDLPEYVRKVVKGNNTLLLEHLLNLIGYKDVDVAQCLRGGFRIVGDLGVSDVCFGPMCAPCRPQHQGAGGSCHLGAKSSSRQEASAT
eukprot:6463578-Amphidinium_carterae.1